jgi:hypothetical protein
MRRYRAYIEGFYEIEAESEIRAEYILSGMTLYALDISPIILYPLNDEEEEND